MRWEVVVSLRHQNLRGGGRLERYQRAALPYQSMYVVQQGPWLCHVLQWHRLLSLAAVVVQARPTVSVAGSRAAASSTQKQLAQRQHPMAPSRFTV